LSLAFTGPGSLSLDSLLGLNYSGLEAGLAALVVGVAGALVMMATRKAPAAPKA
jgi:hypothetical protein